MSTDLLSILVLVFIFLLATVRPVNMGALALVAASLLARDRAVAASGRAASTSTGTASGSARGATATSPGPSGRDVAVLDESSTPIPLNAQRVVTLIGFGILVIGALVFDLDVGFLALAVAVVLTLLFPESGKDAVGQVSWGVVLLIGGVITYVSLLQRTGTIDWLGESVAGVGSPLLAGLFICLIGASVSAFASTTGMLGALIPLAVPLLTGGALGAIGLVTALSISSSLVDTSPFSTNGALATANAPTEERDRVFRGLMVFGLSMIIIAPVTSWLVLVVPGWL